MNNQVGKWMIGFPLLLFATDLPAADNIDTTHVYDWALTYEQNERTGRIPQKDLLVLARLPSVILGVIICLLVFQIGRKIGGNWLGLLVSVLLLTNRVFLKWVTRVMTDVHYNLFVVLLCSCSFILIYESERRKLVAGTLAFALVGALTFSVKINGAAVASALFVGVILYKASVHTIRWKDAANLIAIFVVVSVFISILLNPFFWPTERTLEPGTLLNEARALGRTSHEGKIQLADVLKKFLPCEPCASLWDASTEGQQQEFRGEYPQLSNLAHLVELPAMFFKWKVYEEGLLLQYPDARNNTWSFNRDLFFRYATFPLDLFFLFLGLWVLAKDSLLAWRKRKESISFVPILFFTINYCLSLMFINLNWDRYYLPAIISSNVLVAIGLFKAGRILQQRVRVKRRF